MRAHVAPLASVHADDVEATPGTRAYDLRHSFASPLQHEGRSVIHVVVGSGTERTRR
jgi:hypothetical protein